MLFIFVTFTLCTSSFKQTHAKPVLLYNPHRQDKTVKGGDSSHNKDYVA